MIYDKKNFDQVKILTVAKVGSANFLYCNYDQNVKKVHGHNVNEIRNTLKNNSNCLIIVGIRNPIDRNLSYFFQTYRNNFYNDVKTKKNNYKGEFCHIRTMNLKTDPKHAIELYFKKDYHNTFNDWFEEFLEITNIQEFDKDKGFKFYDFPNNNTILIYTLEKLSSNNECISGALGISNLKNKNDSTKASYNDLYQRVKNEIVYPKHYLDNLLNTNIMKIFYDDKSIQGFYEKYHQK